MPPLGTFSDLHYELHYSYELAQDDKIRVICFFFQ